MATRVELYKGKAGWRWRIRAGNNETLANSEAYSSKTSATKSATKLANGLGVALIDPDAEVAPKASKKKGK